mmetsp:Transcript_7409/g.25058  ORF Transcript_7409/g.25058 Transcript_7409/m.25058 type:complete len:214 (+) Transcript_7409:737-1378(+)
MTTRLPGGTPSQDSSPSGDTRRHSSGVPSWLLSTYTSVSRPASYTPGDAGAAVAGTSAASAALAAGAAPASAWAAAASGMVPAAAAAAVTASFSSPAPSSALPPKYEYTERLVRSSMGSSSAAMDSGCSSLRFSMTARAARRKARDAAAWKSCPWSCCASSSPGRRYDVMLGRCSSPGRGSAAVAGEAMARAAWERKDCSVGRTSSGAGDTMA